MEADGSSIKMQHQDGLKEFFAGFDYDEEPSEER